MLNLKPYETCLLDTKQVSTIQELQDALAQFVAASGQSADVIYTRTVYGNPLDLSFEAQALSDGSIVYNLYLDCHCEK